MQKEITTSLQLYKHLMKKINLLPRESQNYYYKNIRQHYKSHADESDPERIKQIIDRAVLDIEWVVHKYSSSGKAKGEN